ncbi:hypothetical protein CDAR_287791 [Caerostris darwini]|uniref:Uncharacterized protein n=1 Tax=Caerostris darwini TaxID=1538125 RepID=A0AAV4NCU2_9ARAC|nr:hypothetical protein CDAR_287791 [Caerostris darwini]
MYYSDSHCRHLSLLKVSGDEQHSSDEKLLPEGDKLLSVCLAPIHNGRERDRVFLGHGAFGRYLIKYPRTQTPFAIKCLPLLLCVCCVILRKAAEVRNKC